MSLRRDRPAAGTAAGRRRGVQVHVLLRPPDRRAHPGMCEGVSDRIDSVRAARRAADAGGDARRHSPRAWGHRRADLQPGRHLGRRYPRLLPAGRAACGIRSAAASRGADGVPARRVAVGGHHVGAGAGERRARICLVVRLLMRATEDRLDRLREEAGRMGRVAEPGLAIAGGPIPRDAASLPGYYGQPIVKPPVWTWQIGLYLFVGGTAGMSGVLALAGLLSGQPLAFVATPLGVALAGALVSPVLLIWDLGRPTRFLNMLRVFKWRSAMSMGVWTLLLFSNFAGAALVLVLASGYVATLGGPMTALSELLALALVAGTALSGVIPATYTGVLLGATAVPVWSAHHRLLPFHFGIVGLGSAAAVLELVGFRIPPPNAIGLTVAAVETVVGASIEFGRHAAMARAIHEGTSGRLLRAAGLLTAPVPLILRLTGWVPLAGGCFLCGAGLSRYGWLFAGRSSAGDPEGVIATQSVTDPSWTDVRRLR